MISILGCDADLSTQDHIRRRARVLVYYCRDHQCSHHIEIAPTAGPITCGYPTLPDFVCTACGKRGTEFRREFLLLTPCFQMRTGGGRPSFPLFVHRLSTGRSPY